MSEQESPSIMQGTGQGLLDFCDRIGARGDINAGTARAYRIAAGKILAVESPDPTSVDLRSLDADELFERFVKLRKGDYGEGSLNTYRARFRQAIAMYLAWLDDAPNWKTAGRLIRQPRSTPGGSRTTAATRRSKPPASKPGTRSDEPAADHAEATVPPPPDPAGVRLITYDVPLRTDLIIRLTLPWDLTASDAERIANFVRVLAFTEPPPPGSPSALSGSAVTESRAEGRLG